MNKATHNVSEILKWISCGLSMNVIKYSSYLVNGIHFNTKERDKIITTQNSDVSVITKTIQFLSSKSIITKIIQFLSSKDKNPVASDIIFYGIIKEIWELDYIALRLPVFLCDWVESNSGVREDEIE